MYLTGFSANNSAVRLEQLGAASAGVIHDLNNQLMLILNHLELGDVPAAQLAVQTCATLTGSLLDYCRNVRPVLRAVDLSRFVAANAASLNVPSSTRLRLELDTENPPILAEYTGLTRVLHNLVSNAVAATNRSGQIVISVARNELRVSDNGAGIELKNRKLIFEPFFTTKASASELGKSNPEIGTGLGLSIVREIMREHGGSVRVDSLPGEGATFTLRFRLAPGNTLS